MTKSIELTNGYETIVDDDDYSWLTQWTWRACVSRWQRHIYVVRSGDEMRMHRLITNTPKGMMVDHANGDGLDNRRANLRVCSAIENQRNKRKRIGVSSSIFKGVSWDRQCHRWRVQIMVEGRNKSIGRFATEAEAAVAYNDAATVLFGEFALLNDLSDAPPEAYEPVVRER